MKHYLFIDVETGGLPKSGGPTTEEIPVLQVGAAVTDELFNIRSYFMAYVKPPEGFMPPDPAALAVNKITPEQIKNGRSEEAVLSVLQRMTAALLPSYAGYNVGFDVAFIKAMQARTGVLLSTLDDTLDLCKIARQRLSLLRYRLSDVCDHFDLPTDGAHDAGRDVSRTIQIARRLLLGEVVPA